MIELLKIREKNKLTQEEMAAKLKISASYYRKLETGYKQPSFNFINKVILAFPDTDPSIFFKN